MKKQLLTAVTVLTALTAFAELPENSGFEKPADQKDKSWIAYPAENWQVYLGNAERRGTCEVPTAGAFAGKRHIRIGSTHEKGFTSLRTEKLYPVKTGDIVELKAMVKGHGKARLRIYYYDANGKMVKKYRMSQLKATDSWKEITCEALIPAGVTHIRPAVEVMFGKHLIDVDEVKMSITEAKK